MKFRNDDPGNCRVYYTDRFKGATLVYCWQDDGSWGKTDWKFYRCSQDGEPSYEVWPPPGMKPPA